MLAYLMAYPLLRLALANFNVNLPPKVLQAVANLKRPAPASAPRLKLPTPHASQYLTSFCFQLIVHAPTVYRKPNASAAHIAPNSRWQPAW
jgi:hypothetical protein